MSAWLTQFGGLLQAACLAAVVFAFVLSLLSAATYPWLHSRLAVLPPARRADLLLGWAAMPLIGAAVLLLLSFSPSLLALLGLAADHCHLHPDHPHLCLLHPPHLTGGVPAIAGMLAGMTAVVAYGAFWSLDCWRARCQVRDLVRLSHADVDHGMHVIDIDAPLAFAAGLRTPALFVSRSLLARLTPPQLAIVMAHEQAHAVRHDTMRYLIAFLVSRLHLPALRHRLLADLELAAEQACDEQAAQAGGGRLAVAETILSVEKLFGTPGPVAGLTPASHFIGSHVPARIDALLAAPRTAQPSLSAMLCLLGAAVAGLIALAEPLHHTAESLLGYLFH